jgi:hypothetical protein
MDYDTHCQFVDGDTLALRLFRFILLVFALPTLAAAHLWQQSRGVGG